MKAIYKSLEPIIVASTGTAVFAIMLEMWFRSQGL